jgi:hypothetical protein
MSGNHTQKPARSGSSGGAKLLLFVVVGLILSVPFCSRRHSTPAQPDELTYRLAAEALVRQHLRDPSSAEFSDEVVFPGSATRSAIVCGRVNARNGFGGMSGPQRFIAGGTVVLEDEVGRETMSGLWARSC